MKWVQSRLFTKSLNERPSGCDRFAINLYSPLSMNLCFGIKNSWHTIAWALHHEEGKGQESRAQVKTFSPSFPWPASAQDLQAWTKNPCGSKKHKFIYNGEYRLIANRSHPEGRSFDDLVIVFTSCPRILITFQVFLQQVRRLGPGCLVGLFNVKELISIVG